MTSRIEKISVSPRATRMYTTARPKPLSVAWISTSIDRLFLLQRRGDHLGDVDDLARADFADDEGVQELPVDAVGLLAADHERAPHRFEPLLGEHLQHLVGLHAARPLHGLREDVERRVVRDGDDAGHLTVALLVGLAELANGAVDVIALDVDVGGAPHALRRLDAGHA